MINGSSGFLKDSASKVSFRARAFNGFYSGDLPARAPKNSNLACSVGDLST